MLKTEALLSDPFHPQTDGQTEQINATLEPYLRAHVSYLQGDWKAWLHLLKLTLNNHALETTGMSPFFANHGQDPLWQFDLSEPAHSQEVRDARQLATKFKEITTHLQAEILRAQQYPDQADKRHKPAPAFKVGGPCLSN